MFRRRLTSSLSLPLFALFVSRTANAGTPHDDSAVDHGQALIDWLRDKDGGFVSAKIEIRRENPSDPSSTFGVFATDHIAESESVLVVPHDALLMGEDTEVNFDRFGGTLQCETIQKLIEEMNESDETDFAPYVNYLLDQPGGGRIPARWSVAGQTLFFAILGREEEDWVEDAWVNGCGGNANKFELNAAITVLQRSWDNVLVPVMDMINHRNGRHMNVEHNSPREGNSVILVASRSIERNEQLHLSYNFCGDDCWSRRYDYGTTEILLEYGFVESYPQRWVFDKTEEDGVYAAFDIDEKEGASDVLEVMWLRGRPSEKSVAFLHEELSRLKALEGDISAAGEGIVPKSELDTISQYYQALTTALTYAIDAVPKNVSVDHGQALVDWLRARGGFFNSKLEIRRANASDPTSYYGIFATGTIKRTETLIEIPQNALIVGETDSEKDEFEELECGPVHALIDEMNKGERSDYAPYVNYLLDQPGGRTPTEWSEAGQRLLLTVVGYDEKTQEQEIPPYDVIKDWVEETVEECEGSAGPFELNVAFLVLARSWDQIMVPILDMINHRNGNWLNTEYNSPQDGESVYVKASIDIEEGQELHTSYNLCLDDCGARHYKYGTPEILRDYGFVESYPQRWFFDSDATNGSLVTFEIDERDDDSNEIFVHWLQGRPYTKGIEFMQKELDRLSEVEAELEQANGIEPHELSTIKGYHNALKLALTHAVEAALGNTHNRVSIEDATECPAFDWNSIKKYHEALTASMAHVIDYASGNADNSGPGEDVVEIPAAEWNSIKKYHTAMAHAIDHAPGEAHNHDP